MALGHAATGFGDIDERRTGNKFSNNTYKTVRVVGDKYDFSYSVWCTNEHELYNIKVSPAPNRLHSSSL